MRNSEIRKICNICLERGDAEGDPIHEDFLFSIIALTKRRDRQDRLKNIPTSRWRGGINYPVCENCGCDVIDEYVKTTGYTDEAMSRKPMKYCPNCGAKMEVGDD